MNGPSAVGARVTSAVKRALAQQLAELEAWAERSAEYAHGRGKSAKGKDLAAVRVHDDWANRFRRMRSFSLSASRPEVPLPLALAAAAQFLAVKPEKTCARA